MTRTIDQPCRWDTHTIVWRLINQQRLSARATEAIDEADARGVVYVSAMPDRIIAATALPLVSRDRAIQRLGIETIW